MTIYDVFLSHASDDKPVVEALARRLREDGLEPFLDIWHLVPGEPWQKALEDALEASRTCAVFVGRGEGPWQHMEMRTALSRLVGDKTFRVIPVLLPGAPALALLPPFLSQLGAVDCRAGLDQDAYHRLVCGIRGLAPDAGSATTQPASPGPSRPYRSMAPPSDQFVHRRELRASTSTTADVSRRWQAASASGRSSCGSSTGSCTNSWRAKGSAWTMRSAPSRTTSMRLASPLLTWTTKRRATRPWSGRSASA